MYRPEPITPDQLLLNLILDELIEIRKHLTGEVDPEPVVEEKPTRKQRNKKEVDEK